MKTRVALLAFMMALLGVTPAFAGGGATGPDWGAVGSPGTDAPSGVPEATVRSPFALADTQGDAYGSGDITAIKVEHRATTVRLTVRTKLGSNPAASASWRSGDTWIIWSIDVNNSGDADFLAGIFHQDDVVFSEVVRNDSSFTHRCNPTFTHAQSTQFQIEFPRSCISSHPSIRAYATMQYNKYPSNPDAPESVDYSPNYTWTPLVTQ